MNEEARSDALAESIVARTKNVTDNTAQEMIIVTRDKVELALHRNLPHYVPGDKVLSSVGLFVALGTTLLTADFREALLLAGDTWRGIFIFATIASLGLTVRDSWRWLRRPRLDDLVDSIERDSRDAY